MEQNSQTGGASPSYVESLISPAIDQPETSQSAGSQEEQQQQQQQPETGLESAEQKPVDAQAQKPEAAASELPSIDDLVAQFAKETGFDPNDPGQAKTLRRLAEKERMILDLRRQNEALQSAGKPPADLVTEFEKQLEAGEKPVQQGQQQTPPAQQQSPPQPPPTQGKFGDIGDAWKRPSDAYKALNEAWSKEGSPDLDQVAEIDDAMYRRRFDAIAVPAIERYVESRLEKFAKEQLGDVIPMARQSVQERRANEARDFAVGQLKSAGAADIEKMFEPIPNEPPVVIDGQQFPATPLNKIMAEYPGIARIQYSHSDPNVAARRTAVERFRMAYQLYRQQSKPPVTPAAAKQLVQAGADMAARSQDRTRQQINAGRGTANTPGKPGGGSYVESLVNMPGAPLSLASLLNK